MAITPKCNKCGKELHDFGALLFSPPDGESKTIKYHLCKNCYGKIIENFYPIKNIKKTTKRNGLPILFWKF